MVPRGFSVLISNLLNIMAFMIYWSNLYNILSCVQGFDLTIVATKLSYQQIGTLGLNI